MNVRNYFVLLLLLCTSTLSFGQQKAKATEILEKTATSFRRGEGIHIVFSGSQKGELKMQGNKFHLLYGGVESWFDGKTQWSYAADSEEVSISIPTPEEMQETNPYSIFNTYKTHFNYGYKGIDKNMHKIVLVPLKKDSSIKSITLHISMRYIPQGIVLSLQNGQRYSFDITSYSAGKKFDARTFCYDSKKHPQAEIIDLR